MADYFIFNYLNEVFVKMKDYPYKLIRDTQQKAPYEKEKKYEKI